jgi:hypothetical protein
MSIMAWFMKLFGAGNGPTATAHFRTSREAFEFVRRTHNKSKGPNKALMAALARRIEADARRSTKRTA